MSQKLLVTGGNGFVAAQVIITGLKRGHTIVSTVRSEVKAKQAQAALSKYLSAAELAGLTWASVPNIEASDAFDAVLEEHKFDAVLHTATPFRLSAKDVRKELLDPAINGTKAVLDAVERLAPSVKRVVITSSFASILNWYDPMSVGHTYTEKDWNPQTYEEAARDGPAAAYYGAKKLAEKASWDFVAQRKPGFDVVALCPPYVFGEVASHVDSLSALNTSSEHIYAYINGSLKGKEIPEQDIFIWTNVKTLAEAHIRAIEIPEAGGHRFLITNGHYTEKQLAETLAKLVSPEQAANIPTKLLDSVDPVTGKPKGGIFDVDTSSSQKILGLEYGPFEDMVKEFLKSIEGIKA